MLPLHFAAAVKASDAVVAALLEAHPGAAKDKDGVTCRAHNSLRCVAPLMCVYARSLARRRAAQDGRLPLHHAARQKASEAVVATLLAAHPGAAKEKDKVLSPRPHNPLRCPPACIRALTCSLPRCAGWVPPAALCCGRGGVGGGGWGAPGGSSWRYQDE